VEKKSEPWTMWGTTVTLRGQDYVAVGRASNGPEVGFSYNQRLAQDSPVTVGGELFFSRPGFVKVARPGYVSAAAALAAQAAKDAEDAAAAASSVGLEASDPAAAARARSRATAAASAAALAAAAAAKETPHRPLEWTIGAAYDAGDHKSAVHLATTGSFRHILSLHHLYRASDRTSLAAKFMCLPLQGSSMLAAGYRMRFRNTLSTLHGTVDSYGTMRAVVEREPLKDVRVGMSMEAKVAPWAHRGETDKAATFGFRISIGTPAPIVAPLSPCTMTREIFTAVS
jgi:hypothetical protein